MASNCITINCIITTCEYFIINMCEHLILHDIVYIFGNRIANSNKNLIIIIIVILLIIINFAISKIC